MTYASTRVETYDLPDNLRRIVGQVETIKRRHGLTTVTLTREQYGSFANVIARQSDSRVTLEQCTLLGLPIRRPLPLPARHHDQPLSLKTTPVVSARDGGGLKANRSTGTRP